MSSLPCTENTQDERQSITDDQRRNFEIRRAMICHEDGQINHRVTVTVLTQSLLVTAAAGTLFNGNKMTADTVQHPPQTTHFVEFLAMIGIAFGLVMHQAVRSARDEQDLVKGSPDSSRGKPDCFKYKELLSCGPLEGCLQASRSIAKEGFRFSLLLPRLSIVFWLAVLLLLYYNNI